MRAFFGLDNEYLEAVYETIFYMKYKGGFSISETYQLPVRLRDWFAKRLAKQIEDEIEAMNKK